MNKELHNILENLSKSQLIDIIISQNKKIESLENNNLVQLQNYKQGLKDSIIKEHEKAHESINDLIRKQNTQPFVPKFPQPQPYNPYNQFPFGNQIWCSTTEENPKATLGVGLSGLEAKFNC